jgi:hypothetical protein
VSYSQRDKKATPPNWVEWTPILAKKDKQLEIWKLVALSLNKEPDKVDQSYSCAGYDETSFNEGPEFESRLSKSMNYFGLNWSNHQAEISEFVNYARLAKWDMPPEFTCGDSSFTEETANIKKLWPSGDYKGQTWDLLFRALNEYPAKYNSKAGRTTKKEAALWIHCDLMGKEAPKNADGYCREAFVIANLVLEKYCP